VAGFGCDASLSSPEALANLGSRLLCADRDRDSGGATAAGVHAAGGSAEAITPHAALAGDVASVAAAKAKPGRVDIAVTTPG
jgi:hypothetical protein